MKKILSILLIMVLILSTGSLTFAKNGNAKGWNKNFGNQEKFEEKGGAWGLTKNREVLPPGLYNREMLPPGLAKKTNVLTLFNATFELVRTRTIAQLEDVASDAEDLVKLLEDEGYENDLIDEIKDLLKDIDETDFEDDSIQIGQLYDDLNKKYKELKELYEEDMEMYKEELEEIKTLLEDIYNEGDNDLSNADEDDLLDLIDDIDELLDSIVDDEEYEDIFDRADEFIDFDLYQLEMLADEVEAYIGELDEDYTTDSAIVADIEIVLDDIEDENIAEQEIEDTYNDLVEMYENLVEDYGNYETYIMYEDELDDIDEALEDVDTSEFSSNKLGRYNDLVDVVNDYIADERISIDEYKDVLDDADEFLEEQFLIIFEVEFYIDNVEKFIEEKEFGNVIGEFSSSKRNDVQDQIVVIEDILDEDVIEYGELEDAYEDLQDLFTALEESEILDYDETDLDDIYNDLDEITPDTEDEEDYNNLMEDIEDAEDEGKLTIAEYNDLVERSDYFLGE